MAGRARWARGDGWSDGRNDVDLYDEIEGWRKDMVKECARWHQRLPVLPRDLLRDERNVDGSIRQVLSKDLEAIANDYGVDAPDHIRLLVMNRIDHGSKG